MRTQVGWIFAGVVLLGGCRNGVDDAAIKGALQQSFADAARESGVPEEILLAVGFAETRWQMTEQAPPDEEHGGRGAVGMMGVVDRSDDPRLERAAARLGVDADLARTDPATHVRVAAEVLRELASQKGAFPTSIQGWRDALITYGADGDAEVGDSYARAVFDVIDGGARAVASTGEVLVLLGHGKSARGPKTQALVAGADSEGVDAYLGARSGHYHNGRSHSIDRVVIHTTEGSYSGAISWFRSASNPYDTSAHYVIRSSDGEITQMVQEEDTAYHCRDWNSRAIGIEHEAFSSDPSWFTDAMYAASAALVRDICVRRGIPMDRDHIVGHVDVPGNDHSDPGRHWDWDYYLALVQNGQSVAPPDEPAPPQQPIADACNGLDYLGQCSGDQLSWCENGQLYSVDCAQTDSGCGWQDDVIGYNCLAPSQEEPSPPAPEPDPIQEDPCQGIDFLGVCDGGTLVWCQDEELRSFDCGASGDVCGWQDDDVGYNCLAPPPEEPEDPCQGLDYAGTCDGDTLWWCEDETLYAADCAQSAQACGWQDDDVGYNCL